MMTEIIPRSQNTIYPTDFAFGARYLGHKSKTTQHVWHYVKLAIIYFLLILDDRFNSRWLGYCKIIVPSLTFINSNWYLIGVVSTEPISFHFPYLRYGIIYFCKSLVIYRWSKISTTFAQTVLNTLIAHNIGFGITSILEPKAKINDCLQTTKILKIQNVFYIKLAIYKIRQVCWIYTKL